MGEKYRQLDFTHFVVDRADGTVFGSARQNGSGRIHSFLIRGESIFARTGEQWHELERQFAEIVHRRAKLVYGQVPTYKTNRLLTN